MQSPSKGPKLAGKPCQGTMGKIGRAAPISMDKASLFKSPPVTVELSQASTWHQLTGSLVRPSRGVSFRLCNVG